jgi:hypothetical protein
MMEGKGRDRDHRYTDQGIRRGRARFLVARLVNSIDKLVRCSILFRPAGSKTPSALQQTQNVGALRMSCVLVFAIKVTHRQRLRPERPTERRPGRKGREREPE